MQHLFHILISLEMIRLYLTPKDKDKDKDTAHSPSLEQAKGMPLPMEISLIILPPSGSSNLWLCVADIDSQLRRFPLALSAHGNLHKLVGDVISFRNGGRHLWTFKRRGCSWKLKRKIIMRLDKPHHEGVAWTSFLLSGNDLDFFPHGALHLRLPCNNLFLSGPSYVLFWL